MWGARQPHTMPLLNPDWARKGGPFSLLFRGEKSMY